MMRYDLPTDNWRKSSYSGDNAGGNCLETQLTSDAHVAVGDSKDRSQGAFTFSPGAWQSFVDATKAGAFPQ